MRSRIKFCERIWTSFLVAIEKSLKKRRFHCLANHRVFDLGAFIVRCVRKATDIQMDCAVRIEGLEIALFEFREWSI
jgi:hypothetical protein